MEMPLMRASHQRKLANLRERKRMTLINDAFELLRQKLPAELIELTEPPGLVAPQLAKAARLTKVDVLRLTIEYIKRLDWLLSAQQGDAHPPSQLDFQQASGQSRQQSRVKTEVASTTNLHQPRARRIRKRRSRSTSCRRTGKLPAVALASGEPSSHSLDCRRLSPDVVELQKASQPLDRQQMLVDLHTELASGESAVARYLLSWSRPSDDAEDSLTRLRLADTSLWVPGL